MRYDALLLATGAEPVRLDVPGADLPHVHYLRTLADSRALVAKARRCAARGGRSARASSASKWRPRCARADIDVHVVAPETVPMERILGAEVGRFHPGLHEEHGVTSISARPRRRSTSDSVTLKTANARRRSRRRRRRRAAGRSRSPKQAGLAIDRGVAVDEYLETSAPGIFAAGDIARWPDRAHRRAHPRRALGGGRAPGPDRRAQHARAAGARSTPCRSSGPSSTTSASPTSATPSDWDEVEIDGAARRARDCTITLSPRAAGSWRWPSFTAISRASGRARIRKRDRPPLEVAGSGRQCEGRRRSVNGHRLPMPQEKPK